MYQARQSANRNQYLIWPACRKTESLQICGSCEKLCDSWKNFANFVSCWRPPDSAGNSRKSKTYILSEKFYFVKKRRTIFAVVSVAKSFHVWPVICFYLRRLTTVSLYNLAFHNKDHASWINLVLFSELAECCMYLVLVLSPQNSSKLNCLPDINLLCPFSFSWWTDPKHNGLHAG